MSQRIVALDSLRGFLLILMTLDHLGGPIAKSLYGAFGFVSAAEGFFFLSGFVAIKVSLNRAEASLWLFQRMRTIWKWHILSILVIALLSLLLSPWGWRTLPGTSLLFADPLVFAIGSICLLNFPYYLDVLPLYVIFMGMAALFLPLVQKTKFPAFSLLALSLLLWGFSVSTIGLSLQRLIPQGMQHGAFHPFSWQLVFFSGAALALVPKSDLGWWKNNYVGFASLGAVIILMVWKHGLIGISHPSETEFWNSRYFMGPLRILNTASFVVLFAFAIHKFPKQLFWRFPALLGRHSLYVFTYHLPLVYIWLFRPFSVGNVLSIGIPILIVFSLLIPALLHEKS